MSSIIKYRRISKVVLPLVLVSAIAASLWFAAPTPVRALQIDITNPSTGTIGSSYAFTVQVDVENTDYLPITSIDLEIYNVVSPTTKATCSNLPTGTANRTYTSAETGGGSVVVSGTAAPGWYYGYGYRYGYGYSDQGVWGKSNFGYGYGYGASSGVTSITYAVTWTPPSSWPAGTYRVKVLVHGDSTSEFSGISTAFALSAPGGGGGGGGGASTVFYKYVAAYVTQSGRFVKDVSFNSKDNKFAVGIDKDTIGLINGSSLYRIGLNKMADPPAPPAGTHIIGSAYDLTPDNTTFEPPITITISYNPDDIAEGISEDDLVIFVWDRASEIWVELDSSVVDTVNNTVSASVSHFSAFVILADEQVATPASFTITYLSVSATSVDPDDSVIINALVTNNGDLTGTYEVILKINNVIEETKEVTLEGGASRTVAFTTTRTTPGRYSISVGDLTSSFTVREPEAPVTPPVPATFTVSNLSISPTEIGSGDRVTIRTIIANSGDLAGTYEVILKINNVIEETAEVTLVGGASQMVTFTVARDTAGIYDVSVSNLSDSFTVTVPETPVKAVNGLLIGIIIAAAFLVVSVATWLILKKRAATTAG